MRAVVADALRAAGYQVLETAEGAGAMQLLKDLGAVDLLVTDLGLSGGMNGWQLAQAARRRLPALPVLFVTGCGPEDTLGEQTLSSGMALLTKPFTLDVFSRRVAQLLGSSMTAGTHGSSMNEG